MFDPKKLLDELLGSNVPGTGGTVREKRGAGAGCVTPSISSKVARARLWG